MVLLKRVLTLAGAVALVLGVYFIGPGTEPAQQASTGLPPELAEEPDLYLNDAVITEFKPTGGQKFRLHAQRMDRFDDENLTRLVKPRLNMSNAEQSPWDIRAERGVITQLEVTAHGEAGEDVVILNDSVELKQRESVADGPRLTIRSEELTVHPHSQFAETDSDVTIDSAVGRTVASGMQGDLKLGLLQLASDETQIVHTIVLPQQFKNNDHPPGS